MQVHRGLPRDLARVENPTLYPSGEGLRGVEPLLDNVSEVERAVYSGAGRVEPRANLARRGIASV